jgi:hypothetical protein
MGWNRQRLQLKCSIVLPIAQLILAIFLLEVVGRARTPQGFDNLYYSTSQLVCVGINAPATIFIGLSGLFDRVDHASPTILGLQLDEIFFFIGVLILWFVIGRALDQRWSPDEFPSKWTKFRLVLLGVPLELLGGFLFYQGLRGFLTPGRWNNYFGNIVQSTLVVVWSVILIVSPVLKFVRQVWIAKSVRGQDLPPLDSDVG